MDKRRSRRRLKVLQDDRAPRRAEVLAEKALSTQASRRSFLRSATATAAVTTTAAATAASGCGTDLKEYLGTHYKEMTPADKERIFARIAEQARADYDVEVSISDPPPIEGVGFAFCISLSVCNGNRACVHACAEENNLGRDPAMQYIKVLELPRGSMNLESGDLYYEGEVPREDKVYLPMQCNQCDNPPCVRACPIEATWKEPDGIVVIDYDWCIGCRYCMAACPYEARRFNFEAPTIDKTQINPQQGYLSNRVRPRGVVEKCHFCLHRTRKGAYPACMEACPTGARKFGNLNDPTSEVAQIIRDKRVFVLKEELNTVPRIYYYFD